MRVVELYYTVGDLCLLLRLSDSYLRRKIKVGEFGPTDCIVSLENGELRVPASGVNFFLQTHAMVPPQGVAARTIGELRRKVREAVQTSGEEES